MARSAPVGSGGLRRPRGSAAIVSRSSAFFASGRAIVQMATAPSRSTFNSLVLLLAVAARGAPLGRRRAAPPTRMRVDAALVLDHGVLPLGAPARDEPLGVGDDGAGHVDAARPLDALEARASC